MNSLYSLKVGTRLDGRYIVMDVIGEGGFGITYLGFDERLEMKVAIKEYFPQHLVTRLNNYGSQVRMTRESPQESFEKGKKRFLEEAMILGRLESEEGIVNVKDYFEENNTAYFVMEFLNGEDLETILEREGPIDINELIPLLEPIMRSLERVHLEGLIHRDISPDNIILTSSGAAKLVDFGAAKDYMVGEKSQTVILKPGYAPEEQYRSDEEQGPWTDVYALAATIYRCITGLNLPESCSRMVDDCLCNPSELGVNITSTQEHALMKGLAVCVADRYQNMSEFRIAITGPEPVPYTDDNEEEDHYGYSYPEEPAGIRPAFLFGAAGVFILLAVGSGVLFHMLKGRPGNTDDQVKAANEYKLTAASTQTNPSYDEEEDEYDDGSSTSGGQKADKGSSANDSEDGPEGFTGFGESWDNSGISQDAESSGSGEDSSSEEYEDTDDNEASEDIEEDSVYDWSDSSKNGTTEQEAEERTEGWADETAPGREEETTEKQSEYAEAGTTEQTVEETTEGWADETAPGQEEETTESQPDYSVGTTTEEKEEGWLDEKESSTAQQSTETPGSISDPKDNQENIPWDEYDDINSPEGGEKADPIEGSTESTDTEFFVDDGTQPASTEAAGATQPASTEAVGATQPASTEAVGATQPASTEAVGATQPASTETVGDSSSASSSEIVEGTEGTAPSEESTEEMEETVSPGESTENPEETASEKIVEEAEEAVSPEEATEEVEEAESEEIVEEAEEAVSPEEATEKVEEAESEEIVEEAEEAVSPEEATDEAGEAASEEEIVEEAGKETESTEAIGETDGETAKSSEEVEIDTEESGQTKDTASQVDAIDASQADYGMLEGYPEYVRETLDTDRFQVNSYLDDQEILKKITVTDSQSGAVAEVYLKNISPEDVQSGNISLKDKSFYTYIQSQEGQEYQACFKNGKITEFIGPDGQVFDYPEGLDYSPFLEAVSQETDTEMVRLLLDVTAPGWDD